MKKLLVLCILLSSFSAFASQQQQMYFFTEQNKTKLNSIEKDTEIKRESLFRKGELNFDSYNYWLPGRLVDFYERMDEIVTDYDITHDTFMQLNDALIENTELDPAERTAKINSLLSERRLQGILDGILDGSKKE